MANQDIEKLFEEYVDKSKNKSVKVFAECKYLLDDMSYNSARIHKKKSNMDILSLAIIEYAKNHYPDSFKDWENRALPGQKGDV